MEQTQELKVNFKGEVWLYNKNITSDALKGLHFPPNAKSINLSRNQITTLEGVTFPEGLEHLNLSQNQITTLEGVTLPPTVRTLNLSANPELRLTGVNDLSALGWRTYRTGAPMGELNLRGTGVTLKGDVCFIKKIPENFSIVLNEGTYKNFSRSGNGIEDACVAMTTNSNPRSSFGQMVIQSVRREGGKKRQQTKRQQRRRQQAKRQQAKRQQTRRQQTRRQQAKRQQTRRQSKLKK